ncbi:(2,3-dihydroxybenzoyl)adenylate synthase [Catenovulum agarivorans]|uniref:(2,3-dihydroxybenzoyl)adenylate synthase n=1 Tax=Catenovulum agarivorans TaxID=1172192 RepID=UPI0002DAD419|nr:(2,3-dihydroxybenzoyl)adenylate synthase [Catenovulum agarivorans]
MSTHTAFPAEFAAKYKAAGYWQDKPLTDILFDQAAANPEQIAIIDASQVPAQQFSYLQLAEQVDKLAAFFSQQGLQAQDTAIVQLPNGQLFYTIYFALLKIGVLPVNALFNHNKKELDNYLEQLKPKLVIYSNAHKLFQTTEYLDQVKQNYQDTICFNDQELQQYLTQDSEFSLAKKAVLNPDAVAFYQLSGGSTGTPKLIPRTHNDYFYSVRQSIEVCQWSSATRYLLTLPAAHNFSLSSPGALGVFMAGGTLVIASDPSPTSCFPLIEKYQVNWTALVPPALLLWLDAAKRQRNKLANLQYIQVGGAKLNPNVAERVEPELGITLQQVFGMAEGLVNYTRLDDDEWTRLNTQGKPMSDLDEVKIVDVNGAEVGTGEVGLLTTRGPYTFRGYYNAPSANQQAFDQDGFYCSGDLVKQTASGHLIVVGREKEQINRGGEKIDAQEIENELLSHPDVQNVALISIDDALLGEKSCAIIVSRSDLLTPVAIRKYLRVQGVADYKIPDQIKFVDELPLTAVGKIDKRTLRLRCL